MLRGAWRDGFHARPVRGARVLASRGVMISSVHADDFATAGSRSSLDWFKNELEKE